MAGQLFINAEFEDPEVGKSLTLIREDGVKGKGTFSGSGYGVSWEDGGSGSVKGWRYENGNKTKKKTARKKNVQEVRSKAGE